MSGREDPTPRASNLVYTLTVTNNGPSDAQGVVVTDTLPALTTFVSTTGCGNDLITGSKAANVLSGGDGDDQLFGFAPRGDARLGEISLQTHHDCPVVA